MRTVLACLLHLGGSDPLRSLRALEVRSPRRQALANALRRANALTCGYQQGAERPTRRRTGPAPARPGDMARTAAFHSRIPRRPSSDDDAAEVWSLRIFGGRHRLPSRCIVGAVSPGDSVGSTRNHARGVGGEEDRRRCHISGLDPRDSARRLGRENLPCLFL
jgi:hypothetical protein